MLPARMGEFREDEVWAALGPEGTAALVRDFYARVPADPILGPMYPGGDFAGAEERLRDFLVFRIGGEARYLETRGHPRLRQRHAPFPVDDAARARWLELMNAALDARDLPEGPREGLRAFFEQVAAFLVNRA